jgi:hypothetical protein
VAGQINARLWTIKRFVNCGLVRRSASGRGWAGLGVAGQGGARQVKVVDNMEHEVQHSSALPFIGANDAEGASYDQLGGDRGV